MEHPAPDDRRAPPAGVVPPWLWFWLFTYVLNLPNLIALGRTGLSGLAQPRSPTPPLGGSRLDAILGLASLAELLPAAAVAAGVVGVFLPWIRAGSLERRFGLSEPEPGSGAVDEIGEFVRRFAPDARLKVNLLRTDQLAFVYPASLRQVTVAFFGGIVRLWRSDRGAAEAVLLHEIGHLRHGDVLVIGVGSLFETVVRGWVAVVLASFLLPTVAVAVGQMIQFARESAAVGMPAAEIIRHELAEWLTRIGPGVLARGLALLLEAATMFVLPLGAIWLSEVNADRFAGEATGGSNSLARAMDRLASHVGWWRWLLLRMSHPPNRLRGLLARSGNRNVMICVTLVLYPLAYTARLAVLLAYNAVNLLAADGSVSHVREVLGRGIRTYTETVTPVWLALAVCVLVWPVLAPRWERCFGGRAGAFRADRWPAYVAAALVLTLLLGIGRLAM